MILKNAVLFDRDFQKKKADLRIENGVIAEIGSIPPGEKDETADLHGCTITPGFIDIHVHGGAGGDFCDGTAGMAAMSNYLLERGVTSFCGTTMTLPQTALLDIMADAKTFVATEPGAKLAGIDLEGPYLNLKRKGAQNGSHIRPGTMEEFDTLQAASGNLIKIAVVAPEAFESTEFIRHAAKTATVSLGHTDATAEQAQAAFQAGASHATHLFNAMSPMLTRTPGTAGTALDHPTATCELICDGFHIAPAVVRNAFRILGKDRAVCVSDSMRAAGAPEGIYDLGGQSVTVQDGTCRLADGTIAASVSNLHEEFKNLLAFGIDEETALRACTINPARVIGMERKIGSLDRGRDADLLVFGPDYELRQVYLKGERRI